MDHVKRDRAPENDRDYKRARPDESRNRYDDRKRDSSRSDDRRSDYDDRRAPPADRREGHSDRWAPSDRRAQDEYDRRGPSHHADSRGGHQLRDTRRDYADDRRARPNERGDDRSWRGRGDNADRRPARDGPRQYSAHDDRTEGHSGRREHFSSAEEADRRLEGVVDDDRPRQTASSESTFFGTSFSRGRGSRDSYVGHWRGGRGRGGDGGFRGGRGGGFRGRGNGMPRREPDRWGHDRFEQMEKRGLLRPQGPPSLAGLVPGAEDEEENQLQHQHDDGGRDNNPEDEQAAGEGATDSNQNADS